MLNYLYALLFAETRLALLCAGLDPEAGIFHADVLYRGSFVYDVMEAARSDVEAWFLDFTSRNEFSKRWFQEKPDGVVRCNAYMTPRLSQTVALWRRKVEPLAEQVRVILRGL